ncbi:MAG TPA: hypothetical protein VEV83_12690 [Parafilimonas sp.]|nr:hypothetical protein [Parafilimonas sp.]
MRIYSLLLYLPLNCLLCFPTVKIKAQASPAADSVRRPAGLFDNDSILTIRLSGNIRELMNDRADVSQLHPLVLSYRAEDGTEVPVSIQAKTRGHFRKTMGDCTYPPISLQFSKSDTLSSSIFWDQNKLKLVMPCQGEDYVVREWLVYKAYNLVTLKSFRARLVKVELNDTKKNKVTPGFYGILLEEDQQVAARNNDVVIKRILRPEQTDPPAFLKMAMFEYLIGNTDWSVQYQNIKLLATDTNSVATPVPYDFDHAGIVNAPYAKPADELEMSSVRQRRYRGFCVEDMARFDEAIAAFDVIKADIYKLYTDCPFLDEKYIKATVQYLDAFYKTINDPVAFKKEFSYPCDKNGTGNVVIRGLKPE